MNPYSPVSPAIYAFRGSVLPAADDESGLCVSTAKENSTASSGIFG
jgi:hypothetical protein